MKVILSRKGFDSSYGGVASPIFKDGTMLSMPIPEENSGILYKDIEWNGITYDEIWKALGSKKYVDNCCCHLDPDIREGIRKNNIPNWKAAFGQCSSALGHLYNEGVKEGDLFLFFGRFREVDEVKMSYIDGTSDFQAIYGYLQIGNIITGDDLKRYDWHPHSKGYKGKNAIFVASDKLIVDDRETELPGFGTFVYDIELKLTVDNDNHLTNWRKLPWMCDSNISMSYHRNRKYDDSIGCFKAVSRGQEFVIDENDKVTEWAVNLIKCHLVRK